MSAIVPTRSASRRARRRQGRVLRAPQAVASRSLTAAARGRLSKNAAGTEKPLLAKQRNRKGV